MTVKMEKLNTCLLCDSKKIQKLYQVDSVIVPQGSNRYSCIAMCPDCGFIFVNPRPIKEDICEYYPDSYPEYWYIKPTLFEKLRYFKKFEMDYRIKGKGKRFLDVGFGAGEILDRMHKVGYECYGVDISKKVVREVGKRNPEYKLSLGELEDAHYDDNFFDFVSISAVLEHVYAPLGLLKETYRILKPGGIVRIMVPNFSGLYYSVLREKADHFAPQHLTFYTKGTMEKALKLAGFDNVQIWDDYGNMLSYEILKKSGLVRGFYDTNLPRKVLGPFVCLLERVLDKGDVLLARGIK